MFCRCCLNPSVALDVVRHWQSQSFSCSFTKFSCLVWRYSFQLLTGYLKMTSVSQVLYMQRVWCDQDKCRLFIYSNKLDCSKCCQCFLKDTWMKSGCQDDLAKAWPQRTEAKVGCVLKINILITIMMSSTTPMQVWSVGPCQTVGEYGMVTLGCDELGLSWSSDLTFVTGALVKLSP